MRTFSSRCMRERRDMLRRVLQKQVQVAQKLTSTEGKYSRDTMWAWDVAEEISRKISLIEMNINRYSYIERDKLSYDIELSGRLYDV